MHSGSSTVVVVCVSVWSYLSSWLERMDAFKSCFVGKAKSGRNSEKQAEEEQVNQDLQGSEEMKVVTVWKGPKRKTCLA